ncbi:hypothetical protein B0H98_10790 [Vreelandella songnenensis]|uniref:Uncharacterized protein n=1 Tax=Vreelandella songnenensis TaxID=1176243 RepID=A0A2T0V186_9GAMM|nr:hypothetical protein [Halomonas songnenensis]PRY63945.1 hypothetical protein B0H98_10790 [Halomonas songnenensis]
MNNKLVPIIINNPCQKGWGYRTRDAVITLATLILWVLVMSRLYVFFVMEEAVLEQLCGSFMIKAVGIGFILTFFTFHCWAVYNRYLYTSYLKSQPRHVEQPPLTMEEKVPVDDITPPIPQAQTTQEAHRHVTH